MALMQIVIGRKIEALRNQLTPLEETRRALETRREALATREAELEAAVNEVTEETSQEDRDILEQETQAFAEEDRQLAEEETANANERSRIEQEIAQLQAEMDSINERAERARNPHPNQEERTVEPDMNTRGFFGMNQQERDAFFAREDVRNFAQALRTMGSNTRDVSNASLLIPRVVLGVMNNLLPTQSKMYKHVNVQRIPGEARMIIPGTAPEGVWTEMCANTNEVELTFNAVEIDGYMVSAAIFICNAILKDSDIDLVSHVINEMTKGIAKALDKAILYGTGDHMPMGVVTRLAQTAKPEGYPANAREWANLSGSHLISIADKTGIALYQALVEAVGVTDNDYVDGNLVWVMNNKTRTKLVSNAMSFTASGAIAAGLNDTMPVIGGAIETLSFIPDDVIIVGYGMSYLLGEREGATVDESKHYRWLANQTGFKILARYDGDVVIPEAWAAIGIGGVVPSASDVTFAEDKDNE